MLKILECCPFSRNLVQTEESILGQLLAAEDLRVQKAVVNELDRTTQPNFRLLNHALVCESLASVNDSLRLQVRSDNKLLVESPSIKIVTHFRAARILESQQLNVCRLRS